MMGGVVHPTASTRRGRLQRPSIHLSLYGGQKHLRHRQDAYARMVPVGFAQRQPRGRRQQFDHKSRNIFQLLLPMSISSRLACVSYAIPVNPTFSTDPAASLGTYQQTWNWFSFSLNISENFSADYIREQLQQLQPFLFI
jgi:hypothetical protein